MENIVRRGREYTLEMEMEMEINIDAGDTCRATGRVNLSTISQI